jgi:hypothetical protein
LGETAEGTFDYGLESMAVKGALLVQMDAEGEQIVIAYAFAEPHPELIGCVPLRVFLKSGSYVARWTDDNG